MSVVFWMGAERGTVKRKHIRQNRDLVRSNAVQAHRIRQLEMDINRIQSENMELRQEVNWWQAKSPQVTSSNESIAVSKLEVAKQTLNHIVKEITNLSDGLNDLCKSKGGMGNKIDWLADSSKFHRIARERVQEHDLVDRYLFDICNKHELNDDRSDQIRDITTHLQNSRSGVHGGAVVLVPVLL